MKQYYGYLLGNILLLLFISMLYFPENREELKQFKKSNPITASALTEHFRRDENQANSQFLNKYFYVSGTADINIEDEIVLDREVVCYPIKKMDVKGCDKVLVYGKCLGYDSLFDKVKFEALQLELLNTNN